MTKQQRQLYNCLCKDLRNSEIDLLNELIKLLTK